jgi:hypothetical protein
MGRTLLLSVSGQKIQVTGVELYPANQVTEWRNLLALAQQQFGGGSSGLGFWGSPAWVIGASTVQGFLERAASGAKAKVGVATLERANNLLDRIRKSARIFSIREIDNVEIPNPFAWMASDDLMRPVQMDTIAFLDRGKFLKERGLTKADVVKGIVHVPTKVSHVTLGDDFVRLSQADGEPSNFGGLPWRPALLSEKLGLAHLMHRLNALDA